MILVALALLGAATVLFVLSPVFASGESAFETPGDAERELQDLDEKKTRLYESIKDLDFERDSGKVSLSDYELARNDYMSQVADVLARIDTIAPPKKTKRLPAQKKAGGRVCAGCGENNPAQARFCIGCGATLEHACASCGTQLPKEAKFCLSCGKKVAP